MFSFVCLSDLSTSIFPNVAQTFIFLARKITLFIIYNFNIFNMCIRKHNSLKRVKSKNISNFGKFLCITEYSFRKLFDLILNFWLVVATFVDKWCITATLHSQPHTQNTKYKMLSWNNKAYLLFLFHSGEKFALLRY